MTTEQKENEETAMHHKLKIEPAFFNAVVRGDKKHEIRDNSDRGFQAHDTVLLQEFDGEYTGKEQLIEITYVSNFMQKENYVVFSFRLMG